LPPEALAPWCWFLSPRCDEVFVKPNPTDFQVEQVLQSLERASQQFPAESDESASIRLSAYALAFLQWEDQLDTFRQFLERMTQPASQVKTIEHEFADMPEAQRWLSGSPPPTKGTQVKVAGRTHTVWRKNGALLLLPSFTPQELDELAKDPHSD
jgi:hypothetical protein